MKVDRGIDELALKRSVAEAKAAVAKWLSEPQVS